MREVLLSKLELVWRGLGLAWEKLGLAWRGLGHRMGKINAVLLLSLLYGLLLTPLAIGLRLAGRDVLKRKKGAGATGGTYWEEAENEGEMQRQY